MIVNPKIKEIEPIWFSCVWCNLLVSKFDFTIYNKFLLHLPISSSTLSTASHVFSNPFIGWLFHLSRQPYSGTIIWHKEKSKLM